MSFEEKYNDENKEHKGFFARTGFLKTRHGKLKTPFFMPVCTKAAQKHVSLPELEEMGTESVISNSFILSLKPGVDVIREAGGINKFMNFNKGTFTDSGGFQMLLKSFHPKLNDKGVIFKNPFDGKKYEYTPEKVMDIQQDIKSDVAMILDDVPHHNLSYKRLKKSVERTFEWAKRAKKYHSDNKQLLFGIIQGGTHSDLRIMASKQINSLDFDGIAFGGLAIGETQEEMYKALRDSLPELNNEKPRYLMGVGSPLDIIESISLGVDIFDSTFPAQNARHGTAFTSKGKVKIMKGKYKFDFTPLDENCDCFVCKNYTKAYIHHLMRQKEPIGLRYMTYHNFYYLQKLMIKIRKAIKEGWFNELRKDLEEKYKEEKNKTFKKIE